MPVRFLDSVPVRVPVRLWVHAASLSGVALCIGLWLAGQSGAVLRAMHVLASGYGQFNQPFADTYGLLAVMQCHGRGIDIYVSNPCDLYLRPHVYSSVWLLGARIGANPGWTLAVGSALAVTFCLSLFLLPAPRTRGAVLLLMAGVLSNAVIFACYQGNNDLVVFVLAALAGRCLLGGLPARWAGYGVLLAAGSLKFYPVVLMVLALRERARMLLWVAAAACLAFGAFVWCDGADAVRVMHLIPSGKVTQMFGATVIGRGLGAFPYGVRDSVEAPPWTAAGAGIELLLVAAMGAGAVTMVRLASVRRAVAALTEAERVFAAMGCVLMIACFLSGQSYRYRGIFLLFVLPAAGAMWVGSGPIRQGAAAFGLAVIALLSSVHLGNGLDHAMAAAGMPARQGALIYAAYWLARELLWWTVITILLGTLTCLSTTWPSLQPLGRLFRGTLSSYPCNPPARPRSSADSRR